MNYCHYKYADGVCGIFEEAHSLARTARELHTFVPMFSPDTSDVELSDLRSPDVPVGTVVFSRNIEAGEIVTIPTEFLGQFLDQIRPEDPADGI